MRVNFGNWRQRNFWIVLFESADKFGQLRCNYEILDTMWHIPPIWSSPMAPTRKHTANAISPCLLSFALELLHQYIDCVVTITNIGSGALRNSAFLNT